jgi:hypothetical protein
MRLAAKRAQTRRRKMPKATSSRRFESRWASRAPMGAIQVLVGMNRTKPRSEI